MKNKRPFRIPYSNSCTWCMSQVSTPDQATLCPSSDLWYPSPHYPNPLTHPFHHHKVLIQVMWVASSPFLPSLPLQSQLLTPLLPPHSHFSSSNFKRVFQNPRQVSPIWKPATVLQAFLTTGVLMELMCPFHPSCWLSRYTSMMNAGSEVLEDGEIRPGMPNFSQPESPNLIFWSLMPLSTLRSETSKRW